MTPRSFTKYLAIKWAKVSSCTLREMRNYSGFELNSVTYKLFWEFDYFTIYCFKFAYETINPDEVFH